MTEAFKPAVLAGKTVLISGGTSGINLGIARVFVTHGARVAVFGRDLAKAERAAGELNAIAGGRSIGLSADVRDYGQVERVVDKTVDAFGKIDVVVAGAAGNFPAPAIDISANGFKAVIDIDLLGTYNVFRAAFANLVKPGASLIAISATQGVTPMPFQAHVCAAKAGINMLIKCLAMEWGPAGVRVNGISPGPIGDTEGMRRLAPTKDAEESYTRMIPLRRFGRKDEVAALALYLCSDSAQFLTGGIYNCDGGSELGDASADALTSWKA